MTVTPYLALPFSPDSDAARLGYSQLQGIADGIDAYFGAHTTYTPTVKQNATLTMTTIARHKKIGRRCEFAFRLTYSSGTATAGQKVTVTTPFTCAPEAYVQNLPVGRGFIFDSSVATSLDGMWVMDTLNNQMALLLGGGFFTTALSTSDVVYGICVMETI